MVTAGFTTFPINPGPSDRCGRHRAGAGHQGDHPPTPGRRSGLEIRVKVMDAAQDAVSVVEGLGESTSTSPAAMGSTPIDPICTVQHAPYRAPRPIPGDGSMRCGQDLPQGRLVARVGHGVPQRRRTRNRQDHLARSSGTALTDCSTSWPSNCGRAGISCCRRVGSSFRSRARSRSVHCRFPTRVAYRSAPQVC